MEPALRAAFNADFTPEKYAALLRCVNEGTKWPADFRIAETPIFLTREFTNEAVFAANEIAAQTQTPEFARHAASAIPPDWTSSFGGIRDDQYLDILRRTILADAKPENVILLEIEPEKQKTRIDFSATELLLGIQSVCVTKIKKRGRRLFYNRDGTETPVERIYNRVIFDELERRPDIQLPFRFQEELHVAWIAHPNWYYKISKHSLPFIKSAYASPAFFADEFSTSENTDNYVLKPLFSFAGLGVDMEPTREKLSALKNPHQWILQKKVEYASFVPTVDGTKSKAELRMMFVWSESGEPVLLNNLVRMSQGKMMGVNFNKDKTWVGSSIALHER